MTKKVIKLGKAPKQQNGSAYTVGNKGDTLKYRTVGNKE